MSIPPDPFRPTTPEQGRRGVSLARLRQEGRERLSAIVAELGIEGP